MSEQFSIEEFQKAIGDSVKAGMAEALLDFESSKEGGFYYTGDSDRKSFGDFINAIGSPDPTRALNEAKFLQVGVGASGGFTVPEVFERRLAAVAAESAIVRPRADVMTLGEGGRIELPTLDQTMTPSGVQSAFLGGVKMYWTEEGGAKTETEPLFKLVTFIPHEMSGICYVTDKLLRHSGINMDRFLYSLFGRAISFYEDYWFLNGDGAGRPQGVIAGPSTIQVVRTGAGHIQYADVIAMLHAFLKSDRGVWIINHCAVEDIMKLQDDTGTVIWVQDAASELPQKLFGYPIIWSEKVPALGTKGDIGLYDFSYYGIVDGSPMTIESSPHYKFIENQTTYRFFREYDGQPWLSAPITLMDGTTQVSPFVTLATYAA